MAQRRRPDPTQARRGSRLASAVLGLVSLALLAVALEVFFRFAAPQRNERSELFAAHPRLGWAFEPGASRAIYLPGVASHRVRTNPQGFRDASFTDIPVGHRRIAVLGDSFVANLSVRRDEVFTEVLEASLPATSVMNFGVNGYGPVQELLLLETVLETWKPDLVIVNVYLRNDFSDVVGGSWGLVFPMPTAELRDDGVRILAPPSDRSAARPEPPSGLQRSHLWHFLERRLAFLRFRLTSEEAEGATARRFRAPELDLLARELRPDVERRFRILEGLLVEMDARARAAGVPLLFTLSPSFAQVVPEVFEDVLEQADARRASFDPDGPNRRLLAFAAAHGLDMLDLTPALRSAESREPGTYHRTEQHWTARGNRVVAEALRARLEGERQRRP